MHKADLELLVASGVIVFVGLVVWQLALLLTGRRRSFCRDSMRRYDRSGWVNQVPNSELPDMLELRRIVVAVFNNREIPDEKIRNLEFVLLTLKHPFLEVATSDRLWELMTDLDPSSERFRLMRELKFWIEERELERQ